jgi:hypothetical protein
VANIIDQKNITQIIVGALLASGYAGKDLFQRYIEKIQVSASYKFAEGDVIDVGNDLRGIVKEITLEHVILEVDDEKTLKKVLKFLPPKLISKSIVTLVHESKKNKANRLSLYRSNSLSRSNSTAYDSSNYPDVDQNIHWDELLEHFDSHHLVVLLRRSWAVTCEYIDEKWTAFCNYVIERWNITCAKVSAACTYVASFFLRRRAKTNENTKSSSALSSTLPEKV